MNDVKSLFSSLGDSVSYQGVLNAFLILLAAFVLRKVILYLLDRRWHHLIGRGHSEMDDQLLKALRKPTGAAILLLGTYIAAVSFTPPPGVQKGIDTTALLLVILLLSWFMIRCIGILSALALDRSERGKSPLFKQTIPLVDRSAKVVVGIVATLVILQNMGISITGIIASLGLGGLAVALAAQKSIADLFGSFMLLADRPFVVGDWIRSPDGQIEGGVERIGFRSTRIRTFDETLITIPNSRLAEFVIDNVALRPARRVSFTIRLPYHTTADQVRQVVAHIKALLENHPEVSRQALPFHATMTPLVRFTDFGTYAREIMVYYFTVPIEWMIYLEVREEINLKIMDLLEEMGLAIAYPTQMIDIRSDVDHLLSRDRKNGG